MDLVGAILLLPFVTIVALFVFAVYFQMKAGRESSLFEFNRNIAKYFGLETMFDRTPHETIFKLNFVIALIMLVIFVSLMAFALLGGSIK